MMSLHLVRDFFALSLDDTLPLVRATTRQSQYRHDTTGDGEDKNDSHDKNQRTLKHVIILPYRTPQCDGATRANELCDDIVMGAGNVCSQPPCMTIARQSR